MPFIHSCTDSSIHVNLTIVRHRHFSLPAASSSCDSQPDPLCTLNLWLLKTIWNWTTGVVYWLATQLRTQATKSFILSSLQPLYRWSKVTGQQIHGEITTDWKLSGKIDGREVWQIKHLCSHPLLFPDTLWVTESRASAWITFGRGKNCFPEWMALSCDLDCCPSLFLLVR